jgi:hypothetical protein
MSRSPVASTLRSLIVLLLPVFGARAQNRPPTVGGVDTIALQPIAQEPLVAYITGVSEIGSFWMPGGHAALRKLVLPDAAPGFPGGQRVFIVLRPFAKSGTPIVFELPRVEGIRLQETATDGIRFEFHLAYSRDDVIVLRQRIRIDNPQEVMVESEQLPKPPEL